MLLKQDQISPCEVDLEIQVDAEKVVKVIDETYKEFGKRTSVAGFRKGKAPRALIERVVDKGKVREFAVDRLLESAYEDALKESGLEPFAPANVEVTQFDMDDLEKPFLAKARVPLAPKTELGDYVGLAFERKLHTVTDEEVEAEAHNQVIRRTPMIDVIDRPVQAGDHLTVHLGSVDEAPAEREIVVEHLMPEFQAGIVGMVIGEEKTITVSYPDDFGDEELRGKTRDFTVQVDRIREQPLPELTDAWVTENFGGITEPDADPDPNRIDTVDKFRTEIRQRLQANAQNAADYQLRREVLDAVVAGAHVEFPEALVTAQVRGYLRDLDARLKERKVDFDKYLEYKGITFEQWESESRQRARDTLTRGLALRALVEKENIAVTEEDIDAEVHRMAEERRVPAETIRAMLTGKDTLDELQDDLLEKKMLEFLLNASNTKTVEVQDETE